jgi:hypothetical protein
MFGCKLQRSAALETKQNKHNKMWIELTCDEDSELSICTAVTMEKGVTYQSHIENKAFT